MTIPTPDEVFKKSDTVTDLKKDRTKNTKFAPLKKEGVKDKVKTFLSLDAPDVVDVLEDGDKLVYITDKLDIVEKVVEKEGVYTPPAKNELPYQLAQKDRVLEHLEKFKSNAKEENKKLYKDLRAYHKKISDLPEDNFYDLLVLWDIHTYLIEKMHFSPFLYFYAVKERGKSRTAKGAIFVSRRGVFTETIREPDIIRWGNDHHASLGFDSKDFPRKITRGNCDDLILSRFERGATASRTLYPERGPFKDTKVFRIFGPTIIATNRPVDDILESRSISIDMKPTGRQFNNPVVPKDALKLKNRLTAFRIFNFNKELIKENKPAPGRLGDIVSPLYRIVLTFFPEKLKTFKKMLTTIIQLKREEATDTLEAQLVEIVLKAEEQVQNGFLAVDLISSLFNEGRTDRLKIDIRTIGRILKGLGFEKRRRGPGGTRSIFYDKKLLEKLSLQYGFSDLTDVSAITGGCAKGQSTDVSTSKTPLRKENISYNVKGNKKSPKAQQLTTSETTVTPLSGTNSELSKLSLKKLNKKKDFAENWLTENEGSPKYAGVLKDYQAIIDEISRRQARDITLQNFTKKGYTPKHSL